MSPDVDACRDLSLSSIEHPFPLKDSGPFYTKMALKLLALEISPLSIRKCLLSLATSKYPNDEIFPRPSQSYVQPMHWPHRNSSKKSSCANFDHIPTIIVYKALRNPLSSPSTFTDEEISLQLHFLRDNGAPDTKGPNSRLLGLDTWPHRLLYGSLSDWGGKLRCQFRRVRSLIQSKAA